MVKRLHYNALKMQSSPGLTGRVPLRGSELLDEDAELFEVMPRALLSAPLVAALRVLFADAATFGAWSSLDDALVGWPAGGAGPAPAGGALPIERSQPHTGAAAHEHGHAHESEQEGTLGSLSVAAAAHVLPPCALQALHAALRARLSQYRRPGPEGAAAELDRAEAAARRARTLADREAAGARMAALQLVSGERQLLEGALAALQPLLL